MPRTEEEFDFSTEEAPRKKRRTTSDAKPARSSSTSTIATPRHDIDPARVPVLAKRGAKKMITIYQEMTDKLYEREDVIQDILRALVAGENVLLLGLPGTGKTFLAEALGEHIEDANLFKWLMNKTTDPADIIGPYSIKGMERDRFRRVLKGKAADSEVVFIDEIFKANEPVLNFMLSMLNEGYVYNDGQQVEVPLRITLAASNEFPDGDELEAFYDRFIFRHWVNYIQDGQNRIEMARASRKGHANTSVTTITLEELDAMQIHVRSINFPSQMEKFYDRLIRTLNQNNIVISDRRYAKGQLVMMANALLDGRDTVNGNDFAALKHVLWNKDVKEIAIVEKELDKFANPHEAKLKEMLAKATEVLENTLKVESRTERASEAVTANQTLNDILGKMEDEVDEAQKNGVDIKPMKKFVDSVQEMMEKIAEECLRPTARSTRKW